MIQMPLNFIFFIRKTKKMYYFRGTEQMIQKYDQENKKKPPISKNDIDNHIFLSWQNINIIEMKNVKRINL